MKSPLNEHTYICFHIKIHKEVYIIHQIWSLSVLTVMGYFKVFRNCVLITMSVMEAKHQVAMLKVNINVIYVTVVYKGCHGDSRSTGLV